MIKAIYNIFFLLITLQTLQAESIPFHTQKKQIEYHYTIFIII